MPHSTEEQAVLIVLDGVGLPDEIYSNFDLATLEDQLIDTLEQSGLGEWNGNEFGPQETTVYLYGPDAEAIFALVEPILKSYPLCHNAQVVVRSGGPLAPERTVQIFLNDDTDAPH